MTTDTTGNENAVAPVENKSFLEQAQDAIGDALESTVEAVKEHPIAAAAIGAAAAAAVGGAAYAASHLLGDKEPANGGKKS
ncbi:MAG: hypothetical protein WDN44_04560 [Sphingomonas sp.]